MTALELEQNCQRFEDEHRVNALLRVMAEMIDQRTSGREVEVGFREYDHSRARLSIAVA
jgi:hypothetical protein